MSISNNFFKYAIYYPTTFLRGEWLLKHLANLEKTQYINRRELLKLQLERLNNLVAHARINVPFYHDLPTSSFTTLEDLKQLPFLEKDSLRNDSNQLFSINKGFLTRFKTTGGSTGAPVTLRKDSRGMAQELAATWRGYRWAGIDVGDKQARFWGIPKNRKEIVRAKIIDWVAHRKRLSAFSFSERDLSDYVDQLNHFKPDYFYGYVSMIREYAEYLKRNNIRDHYRPKSIITTAEVLTDKDRKILSEVFECAVFNEYGCGEIGTIAHECEKGALHVCSENMIVEIVDEEGNAVRPGEIGEIIITDLVNYSMPLIRYRIKDYAALSDSVCACGRSLPVLEKLRGREYDMLVDSSGKYYHGEFFLYIFEDLKKRNFTIDAFQIIQDNLYLEIKVICSSEDFISIKNYLVKELLARFDESSKIDVFRVSKIDREASGKLRLIKRL